MLCKRPGDGIYMTGNEIHSAGDYRGPNAKRHNHNYGRSLVV